MKLYHFALFFAVIACGSMVVIQVHMLNERRMAELRQMERDCLASAADEMTEELFVGKEEVSLAEVSLAGDNFFQALSLCRNGVADVTTKEYWKRKVVLIVCEKKGYYRFRYNPGGHEWWKFCSYEKAELVPPGLVIPSVVVVSAGDGYGKAENSREGIYVVSGIAETKYYVTEDKIYHSPKCDRCKDETVIFCYPTMEECARKGAYPCDSCLR